MVGGCNAYLVGVMMSTKITKSFMAFPGLSDKAAAKVFGVYYRREPTFRPAGGDQLLQQDYVFLGNIAADSLDDVFVKMQGENWSPNGEATPLIAAFGLKHTSMSVGDVIHDSEADVFFEVLPVGFRKVAFVTGDATT